MHLLIRPEVERVCEFISEQQAYPTAFLLPEYHSEDEGPLDVDLNNKDDLFEDAARLIVLNQMGSTSMIQRKFSIGYNRAGRIMDQLEGRRSSWSERGKQSSPGTYSGRIYFGTIVE